MTKPVKKIAKLIERAKADPLHPHPLHPDDEMVRAHIECLLDDWRKQLPLSEDDRDVLMYLVQEYVFPGRQGRFPKRLEAREALAQALDWGRQRKADLKAAGYSADEAAAIAVRELIREKPAEMQGKTTKTIKGLLQRRV